MFEDDEAVVDVIIEVKVVFVAVLVVVVDGVSSKTGRMKSTG